MKIQSFLLTPMESEVRNENAKMCLSIVLNNWFSWNLP